MDMGLSARHLLVTVLMLQEIHHDVTRDLSVNFCPEYLIERLAQRKLKFSA